MEDSYSIRLTEYARVTQQLLYSILTSGEVLSEEAKISVEASLLLSSYALNEQREIADSQIVIMLVKANDVLGNLFYLYEEALVQNNRTENEPDSASMAEANGKGTNLYPAPRENGDDRAFIFLCSVSYILKGS